MNREIVLLSRSLPLHGLGGMEIVAWDLSCEIARSGLPITVITTPIPGRAGEFEMEGVRVVPLDGTPTGRYSAAWWHESKRYFETNCMTSASTVLSVSAAGFGLLPLKRQLPHVPFIMQAHGTSIGEFISKWRSRQLRSILSSARNLAWLPKDLLAYCQFDAVVAVGSRVELDLTRPPISWVLPSSKVHLINNGIDTSLFRPSNEKRLRLRKQLGLDNQIPIIISANRLHAQKGVAHGLKAFKRLLPDLPDAIYLIAGDGPDRQRLESLAQQLGVKTQVRFLGALNRFELAEWLQAADTLLFLTDHVEGLPLNVLEALATGLPVVISDHLKIFDSPAIRYVQTHDIKKVTQELLSSIKLRKSIQDNTLPNIYKLSSSSQSYLDLIKQLKMSMSCNQE